MNSPDLMPDSADADDTAYLLHALARTPVRLRVNTLTAFRPAPGSPEDAAIAGVRAHPGLTVPQLWDQMPLLRARPYDEVQALVVGLLDEGTLARTGWAPLEEVDPRYRRLATCPVCGDGATAHAVQFWKEGTPLVRCPQCTLLYANPQRSAVEAALPSSPLLDRQAYAAQEARWAACLYMLAGGEGPGHLLDVGEEPGAFGALAARHGWQPHSITLATLAALAGVAEESPASGSLFDAITIWDGITCLPDPRAVLVGAARLLRPGGMLLLTTPNIRSVSYGLLGRQWSAIRPNTRLLYLDSHILKRLLTSTGYTIHALSTGDTAASTWTNGLPLPQLAPLAPRLAALARLPITRLMLGDELLVFARRET